MINNQRTLGEEIKRLMIKMDKNKTIQEHSKDLGISHVTLSRIINSNLKYKPHDETYNKLSIYFNIQQQYLKSLPQNYKLLNIDDDQYRKDNE